MDLIYEALECLLDFWLDISGWLDTAERWLIVAVFAAILHGAFLTPGDNPGAGKKVEELVAGYQPAAPNSWDEFQALCDAQRAAGESFWREELRKANEARAKEGKPQLEEWDEEVVGDGSEVLRPSCPDHLREASRRYVEFIRAEGIFARQAAIGSRARFVRPVSDGPLIDANISQIGSSRAMTRIGAARMFIAHERGDDAEWVRALDDTLAVAQVLGYQHTILDRLVACAAQQFAISELKREVMERRPSAVVLRDLLKVVDRRTKLAPVELTIEWERLSVLDAIARTHTDDGNGNGRLILAEVDKLGRENQSFMKSVLKSDLDSAALTIRYIVHTGFPSKVMCQNECNRTFDAAREWLRLPPHDRAKSELAPAHFMERAKSKNDLVLGILVPSFERLAEVRDIATLNIAGAQLFLSIELFRAERGVYPNSLAELCPDFIADLPKDPLTGGDFLYRRLNADEDPMEGQSRPYLLYSPGLDGKDNRGMIDPARPNRGGSPEGAGLDFVINVPR